MPMRHASGVAALRGDGNRDAACASGNPGTGPTERIARGGRRTDPSPGGPLRMGAAARPYLVPDRKPLNPSNCKGFSRSSCAEELMVEARTCRNTSGLGQSGGNLRARNSAGVAGKKNLHFIAERLASVGHGHYNCRHRKTCSSDFSGDRRCEWSRTPRCTSAKSMFPESSSTPSHAMTSRKL